MYPDPSNDKQLGRLLQALETTPIESSENPCKEHLEILPGARSQDSSYEDTYHQEITSAMNVDPGSVLGGLIRQVFGGKLEWRRIRYVDYVVKITDHQQVLKKPGYDQCCAKVTGGCGTYLINEIFKGQTKLLILLDNNATLGADKVVSYTIDTKTIQVPLASGASVSKLRKTERTTPMSWSYYRTNPPRATSDATPAPTSFWKGIVRDPVALSLFGASVVSGAVAYSKNEKIDDEVRELAVLRDNARTRDEQVAFNLRLAGLESTVDERDSARRLATLFAIGLVGYVGIRLGQHAHIKNIEHESPNDRQGKVALAYNPSSHTLLLTWRIRR